MAKKQNLLKGFSMGKLKGLNNGIEIPVTNSLKQTKQDDVPTNGMSGPKGPTRSVEKPKTSQNIKNKLILPGRLSFEGKGVEPMVNVVPTSKKKVVPTFDNEVVPTSKLVAVPTKFKDLVKKKKVKKLDLDFDTQEFGALQSKQDKITYLALRGWSIKVEQRGNSLYHYATKYVNRKKQRMYLGSVNS
jgi:hypothetical protein